MALRSMVTIAAILITLVVTIVNAPPAGVASPRPVVPTGSPSVRATPFPTATPTPTDSPPTGDIALRHAELGGDTGSLGAPVGERTPAGAGFFREYRHGVLVWGPHTGAVVISRTALPLWLSNADLYGWPIRDAAADGLGVHNHFEHRELVTRGRLAFAEEDAGPATAILICDSQCDDDSWSEQGARRAGFPMIMQYSYGGAGYSATSGALGMSVTDGLHRGRFLLPAGDPGLVLITLGGNDATQRVSDELIVRNQERLLNQLRAMYPRSPIIVNGVLSRADEDHAHRREIDALVTANARRLGFPAISVAGWGTTFEPQYGQGPHLTQAGHNKIAAPYTDALRRALRG